MSLFTTGQNAVQNVAYAIQIADGTTPQDLGLSYGAGAKILFRAHVVNTDSIDHNVFLWIHYGSVNVPIGFATLGAASAANPTFQDLIAGLAPPANSGIPINQLNETLLISVAEAVTVDGAVAVECGIAV